MKTVIVTNNPKVAEVFAKEMEVDFLENRSYGEVLEAARDAIHRGARLLTHPMAGSLKPNQTPYRSMILMAGPVGPVDLQSLDLIENGVASHDKFMRGRKTPNWNEAIRRDFQTVDLSHIAGCVKKANHLMKERAAHEVGIG